MFNLTPEERRVVLFLIIVALVGIATDLLAKKYAPNKTLVSFSENIGKVDLNKADRELLKSIPGIGEKLSQRIVEYREQKGSFNAIEELKNIKGITNYRYQKIKDYLLDIVK